MDFDLNAEQQALQTNVRNFAEKEISPLVQEAEEKEKYPVALFSRMGSLGYLCPRYPKELGGLGLGKIGDCICVEEVSRICAGIAAGITTQCGIGTSAIFSHGSEAQKEKYLIPAIKGKKIGAFALTEPKAGSDAAAIEATAAPGNGAYTVNGRKIFITNGPIADFVLVAAYTDKAKGPGKGVSLFVIEKGTPGFTATKMHKFCFRASENGELIFQNCNVSKDQLIGEEGRGFPYVMEILAGGRISHSARSLGIAQAAYEASIDYSKKRVQFGQPIASFEAVTFKIVQMAVEIEAARWLMYRAAWLYDKGREHFKEAAAAKYLSAEVAVRVTNDAMKVHGGCAFTSDSPVQRYFRDARLATITEGTSEIQQLIIGRQLGLTK